MTTYHWMKPAWMRRRPDNWPDPLPAVYQSRQAPPAPPSPCRCPTHTRVRAQVERVRRERVKREGPRA